MLYEMSSLAVTASQVSTLPRALKPVMSDIPIYPLSVEQYHQMIDIGIIRNDSPVELLEGVLVFKMGQNPPHTTALRKLIRALNRIVPEGYLLSSQVPITLCDGEPEPDVSIARGQIADFSDRHPSLDENV